MSSLIYLKIMFKIVNIAPVQLSKISLVTGLKKKEKR